MWCSSQGVLSFLHVAFTDTQRVTFVERQRYVFARDGSVRYGSDNGINWSVRNDFREPVFCKCCMGYNYDNSYSVLNIKAIDKSDMRYSQHQHYHGNMLMSYLHAYCPSTLILSIL